MALHCETTGFIPEPGASYTSSIGRHGPRASKTICKAALPGASSRSQPLRDARAPGAPGGSPAPQEAQLSSSARGPGRGGALAPGPGVFIGMWSGASRKPSGRPALGKWIAN